MKQKMKAMFWKIDGQSWQFGLVILILIMSLSGSGAPCHGSNAC